MTKKNNWLKLNCGFFDSLAFKKLSKIGNDQYKYIILYQKIMLETINNEGHYYFQNIESTIEEEIALIFDFDLADVKFLLDFLKSVHLLQVINSETLFFSEVSEMIGEPTTSRERVANYRARQKLKADNVTLHVTDVTKCNVTCNNVTPLDIDKDIDKEKKRKNVEEIIRYFNEKSGKNKYKSGSDKVLVKKYILQSLKSGDSIDDLKLLIDFKLQNPNTKNIDLTSWLNSQYLGSNLSKAKEWQLKGRHKIPVFTRDSTDNMLSNTLKHCNEQDFKGRILDGSYYE